MARNRMKSCGGQNVTQKSNPNHGTMEIPKETLETIAESVGTDQLIECLRTAFDNERGYAHERKYVFSGVQN